MENKHEHKFTDWEHIPATHALIRICTECHAPEFQHYSPEFSTTHTDILGEA